MTSIEMLLQRQSNPLLCEPAPKNDELELILSAGMRVPDHACLQPWHFTVITDAGLKRLSDLFVNAIKTKTNKNINVEYETKLIKTAKMPFRAPLIIIVSTTFQEHEKVPNQEQLITAGCCVHAMQMAAFSLGYGTMWRTGSLAYNRKVKIGLGINLNDEIVGFLYIGTPTKEVNVKPIKPYKDKVTYWR